VSTPLPSEIITPEDERHGSKLGTFFRRLSSGDDVDIVNTTHAMRRMLSGVGVDLYDVADHLEHSGNGTLIEAEMQEIYNAGVKEGVRQAEQKMRSQAGHQMGHGTPQFPSPRDMVIYCYQRIDRLNDWEREFITNMMGWIRRRPLYPKQQNKIEDIYVQLGGRV